MNTDHVEPFVADGGKAVRRCRRDDDDVPAPYGAPSNSTAAIAPWR
ncbi:MAG: hypothetical protein KGM96_14855 [Acidobacteriota bacterium]|nr:hypothetical protein [Acidobacteriota bacterium]